MQPEPYVAPPKKENAMGLTGFVVSLVGLFLCGIPSLIGLILSAIGLKKEPRGLAIAGVIIGLIGIVQLAGVSVIGYRWVRMTQDVFSEMNAILAEAQLEQAAVEIGKAWEEQQQIPTQEEGEEMLIGKNDMMNNSLVYETDGTSFSIRSAGPDGVLDTEDDTVVGPFEDPQAAIDLESDFEDWGLDDDSPEDAEAEVDDASGESTTKPDDLMEN